MKRTALTVAAAALLISTSAFAQSVGEKTHQWGSATSPVIYKNLVIVNANVQAQANVLKPGDTLRLLPQMTPYPNNYSIVSLTKQASTQSKLTIRPAARHTADQTAVVRLRIIAAS